MATWFWRLHIGALVSLRNFVVFIKTERVFSKKRVQNWEHNILTWDIYFWFRWPYLAQRALSDFEWLEEIKLTCVFHHYNLKLFPKHRDMLAPRRHRELSPQWRWPLVHLTKSLVWACCPRTRSRVLRQASSEMPCEDQWARPGWAVTPSPPRKVELGEHVSLRLTEWGVTWVSGMGVLRHPPQTRLLSAGNDTSLCSRRWKPYVSFQHDTKLAIYF